ncbi:cyclase family protein [Microterricola viridarii]|uniref:Cyclase n=1 Tax=Microterricola viridarii TaxID=412690 RepID=A0A0X8E323_9MICO|nr:cyclase family protein [Microterricola viridarii]AMB59560.1 cyclase [Microterricola viridarii]
MTEYRARFDATVTFVNGGDLVARGFRLDLPSAEVSKQRLAELFVRHLGLTLVEDVSLTNIEIVREQHRGSRGIPFAEMLSEALDGSPLAERLAAEADAEEADTEEDAGATAPAVRRIVDLSHVIRAGLVTYPGLPAPVITPHLTREDSREKYAPGTEFAMDTITMIGNTGTYLDSPYHRYEGGRDLAELSLESLVELPAEVFHLTDAASRGIPAEVFFDRQLAGAAVLLHTGSDRLFGQPEYAVDSPFLTEAGARHLVEQGVALVGIDALNIDDTESGGERPAHTLLLEAGIHVVEHLTRLEELPARGARFTAVPPKVEGFGTFPVRAFATLDA